MSACRSLRLRHETREGVRTLTQDDTLALRSRSTTIFSWHRRLLGRLSTPCFSCLLPVCAGCSSSTVPPSRARRNCLLFGSKSRLESWDDFAQCIISSANLRTALLLRGDVVCLLLCGCQEGRFAARVAVANPTGGGRRLRVALRSKAFVGVGATCERGGRWSLAC